MASIFDPCFRCKAKNADGSCPLPLCLYDAYTPKELAGVDVGTILLWEQGKTLEEIQAIEGVVYLANVTAKVRKWRDQKRKAGLLI